MPLLINSEVLIPVRSLCCCLRGTFTVVCSTGSQPMLDRKKPRLTGGLGQPRTALYVPQLGLQARSSDSITSTRVTLSHVLVFWPQRQQPNALSGLWSRSHLRQAPWPPARTQRPVADSSRTCGWKTSEPGLSQNRGQIYSQFPALVMPSSVPREWG